MIPITIVSIIFFTAVSASETVEKLHLFMPNVIPKKEAYLCTAFKLDSSDHQYIVEFTPNATKHTVHHIIVYGCQEPGFVERDTPRLVWKCGEMSEINDQTQPPCQNKPEIIYAWAMDAPTLRLPKGVGFKVAKNTGINYLVLQIHYSDSDHLPEVDASGVTLSLLPSSTKLVNKRAGVMLLGTGGFIAPMSIEHMETACVIREPVELNVFAYRTHTHRLGTAVSGWRVRGRVWTLIGKRNPQTPQMFYAMKERLVIRRGDVVAARCTIQNRSERLVTVGATAEQEMCNFYLMYFVNGDRVLRDDTCFSAGPPFYSWDRDRRLAPIPEAVSRSASEVMAFNDQ